jgi:uncharacterized membrane protein YkvA (DUF1232 family)
MNYDYDINQFNEQYNSELKVEEGTAVVEERLWDKVAREGSKIRFMKEVRALYRYLRDKNVPWYRKSVIVGALIYFITPIDLIPDFIPILGYLDDLGVIMAAVKFLGSELVPYYD